MSLYRLFIISFIVCIIATVVFFGSYFSSMLQIIRVSRVQEVQPEAILSAFFSPVWLAALVFMSITALLYRVLGIVFAVRNPNLEGGEKAMWVIGFVLFGFITAIIFMVMASSRNLTATEKPVSIAG